MQPTTATSKRPGSKDVARMAGVSRSTVSFVLNGTPGQTIPAETQRRVREAAAALRYSPSAEARTLSRGRSDVVLLQLPSQLPYTADLGQLIEHLAAEFAELGLTVLTRPWSLHPRGEVWPVVTPTAVLVWEVDDEDVATMIHNGVRAVVSFTGDDPVAAWILGAREDGIAEAQVTRLLASGHSHLGYARPHDPRMAEASALRMDALGRACARYDLPTPVALSTSADGQGAAPAEAAVRMWSSGSPRITGVCAHDDVAALAVLAGARNLGLQVPADLAVVGVGDSSAARLADPPLTMVVVDPAATARYIVQVVVSLLAKQPITPGPDVAAIRERSSV